MKRIEDLTQDTFVEVFNNTQGSIGYTVPGGRSRVWEAPTFAKVTILQKIKFGELQEGMNIPSVYEMYTNGKLLVKDGVVREALELPELDGYTLDSAQLLDFFNDSTEEEFEDMLANCSNAMFSKIVDMAIQNPLRSTRKARILEEYSGRDVLKLSKELEEEKLSAPQMTTPGTQRRVVKGKDNEAKPSTEGALRGKVNQK